MSPLAGRGAAAKLLLLAAAGRVAAAGAALQTDLLQLPTKLGGGQ